MSRATDRRERDYRNALNSRTNTVCIPPRMGSIPNCLTNNYRADAISQTACARTHHALDRIFQIHPHKPFITRGILHRHPPVPLTYIFIHSPALRQEDDPDRTGQLRGCDLDCDHRDLFVLPWMRGDDLGRRPPRRWRVTWSHIENFELADLDFLADPVELLLSADSLQSADILVIGVDGFHDDVAILGDVPQNFEEPLFLLVTLDVYASHEIGTGPAVNSVSDEPLRRSVIDRIILDHTIVNDKAIGCGIRGDVFLAIEFYANRKLSHGSVYRSCCCMGIRISLDLDDAIVEDRFSGDAQDVAHFDFTDAFIALFNKPAPPISPIISPPAPLRECIAHARRSREMRFVRQPIAIKVTNLDGRVRAASDAEARRHGPLLPNAIRCVICGPSNCGKTNALISLLESPHGLRFENVYVYSKSLQQPKYRYLENLLAPMEDIGYFTFSNNSDVISPSEALPNSIFNTVREYFAMGRHSNVDCFYLCQTYAKIPKHLIRDNTNLLILFKQDGTNLRHAYNDHVNTDMSYENFHALCRACWRRRYGFLVIDKDSALRNAKTRASIRRKHRALKTGKMESEVAMETRFKPIVEPLRRIAEHAERDERNAIKREEAESATSVEGNEDEEETFENDLESPSTFESPSTLETSVKRTLRTPQGRQMLHDRLGPLGRKYVGTLLGGERSSEIDNVYGVYISEDGAMLGDKRFDVDTDDSILINGIRYVGTPGLYELIFKRMPDDLVYTENDKLTYRNILLTTNAHRRDKKANNPILGNKGYKYKHVIAPLLQYAGAKTGTGRAPSTMRVTGNRVEYVHWDDPNELVDRLRLLDASRRAGNNAHDNEIQSIIEELREAGAIL
ncbi:hypothetical protein ACFW04_008292 [Cataglyphis niger]